MIFGYKELWSKNNLVQKIKGQKKFKQQLRYYWYWQISPGQMLGMVQVLRQQVFPDLGPSPSASALSAQALIPPLICCYNTWIEGEMLDDFGDTFQLIKICFSITIRNIFWFVGAEFKDIWAWFRKIFISLLIISSILERSMLQISHPVPSKCQHVRIFA